MSGGFSFDGVNCSQFGITVKNKSRPILSGFNDSYLQVPGRQGTYLFSNELKDKIIEIDCLVSSVNFIS